MESALTDAPSTRKTKAHPKVRLASRKDMHLVRKLWHIMGVSFVLWLYTILPYKVGLGLISTMTAFILINDYLRMQFRFYQKIVLFVMRPFMREEERRRFTGLSFMCLGFWLLILLFPRDIVTMTLLFVMFGDPIAAVIGTKFGKDKIGDKSLQGFIACFLVCTTIALAYLYYTQLISERLIYATLLSGLIGGLAELIQLPKLDDNLSMPIIAATLLSGLFYFIT